MNFFNKVEKYIGFVLLALLAVVVASATLEIAYEIATNIFAPPGFFIGVQDLVGVYGLFLMVLIGLELMTGIHMFLKDNKIHADLMLLVAITAVTRKIVTMDSAAKDPMIVFGIGFLVIALAAAYYLVSRSKTEPTAG